MTASRRCWPDAVAAAIVLAVFAFIALRLWGRAFEPVVDAGRDLYIAEQLHSGATLYRDIVYIFPPLAPYLLAAITAVTGSSLTAYQSIGLVVALATCAVVYALARTAGSTVSAGAAGLLFAAASICSVSDRASNYLLPYSQAATIGMLLFAGGGALLLIGRRWSIAIGLIALVAASWMKIEYATFAAAAIVVYAWVTRARSARLVAYAVALLASVAALGWYYAAGEPALFNKAAAHFFYFGVTGLTTWPFNLTAAVIGFAHVAAIAGVIAIASRTGWIGMIGGAVIVGAIGWYAGLDFFRGWLLVQLLLVPFALRRPREPLLFLLVLSLCASSRLLLNMTPQWYGFIFLVPVYPAMTYVAFDWLPWYSRRAALLWLIPIAFVSAELLVIETAELSLKHFPVASARGTFFDGNADRAGVLDEFLRYADAHRIDSLVVIPEGLGIDYLAKATTPLRFHTFNPLESGEPHIEREIIGEIETRKPPHIAIVTRVLSDYASRGFGVDYDLQLAGEIRARYAIERVWRRPEFQLILLRRRS